jgi:hypothetical protein
MNNIIYLGNQNKFYNDFNKYLLQNNIDVSLSNKSFEKSKFIPKFIFNSRVKKEFEDIKDIKISHIPYKNLDVYIHNGNNLTQDDKEAINSAKKVIVDNKLVLNSIKEFNQSVSIDIIYPYFLPKTIDKKQVKKQIYDNLGISTKSSSILFYANSFKAGGLNHFVNIINSLSYKDFILFIAGEQSEIDKYKFTLSKISKDIQLYTIPTDNELYKIDNIFAISDIYILPTTTKKFALNILKALAYKSAVFVSRNNSASEIVDTFAILEGSDDATSIFRIEALLQRKDDLKAIKKFNYKLSKQYTPNKYFKHFFAITQML